MLLAVGRILRPHGIRGEVMVEVRTDDPGQRFATGRVLATQPPQHGPLTVAGARPHDGGLIVSFAEVTDRTRAQRLSGALLVIDSAGVPAPDDPEEFHDSQLIGLTVQTVAGREVGVVADVRHHGQDLLVIRPADNPIYPERLPLRDTHGQAEPAPPGSARQSSDTHGQAVKDQKRDPGTARDAELLVPFVAAIVPEVDLEHGRLVIDPPPGLLDDTEAI